MYIHILKTEMYKYFISYNAKQNDFIYKYTDDQKELKLISRCPHHIKHIPTTNIKCIYQLPPQLFTEKHLQQMFLENNYYYLQHLDDTIIEKYNNIIYNELTKNLYHVVHLNIKQYHGSKPAQKIYDRLFNFCLAKYFNNDVIGIIYKYCGF